MVQYPKSALALLFLFVANFAGLFRCGYAQARDGFEAVQCNADIPNALIGKHMSSERVVVLESRHKDIRLKDLGAFGISDHLNVISWLICGKEYLLLEDDHNVIRDVLPFPSHSKSSPQFMGTCKLNGQDVTETIIAVLDNHAGYKTPYALSDRSVFPVLSAWKIDEKNTNFVKSNINGLRCPRDGISTIDGGP